MMCVQLIRFQNKIACIDLIWLFLRQNAHFGIDRPTRLKWVGPLSAHGEYKAPMTEILSSFRSLSVR